MKSFKIFSILLLTLGLTTGAFAQSKTESFKVSGNCGMCKAKIEKAAKDAGATSANWNEDTKNLTVKYNSKSTNTAKIQKQIASVGYDNAGFKASDAAYNKLHTCCQYDRTNATTKTGCSDATCKDGKGGCCKDEKSSKATTSH